MATSFPVVDNALIDQFVTEAASFSAAVNTVYLVTTGSSAVTATLPPVGLGGSVTIKKMDAGTGAITVKSFEGAAVLVDGAAGNTGRALAATQYLSTTWVSDGAQWIQVW